MRGRPVGRGVVWAADHGSGRWGSWLGADDCGCLGVKRRRSAGSAPLSYTVLSDPARSSIPAAPGGHRTARTTWQAPSRAAQYDPHVRLLVSARASCAPTGLIIGPKRGSTTSSAPYINPDVRHVNVPHIYSFASPSGFTPPFQALFRAPDAPIDRLSPAGHDRRR